MQKAVRWECDGSPEYTLEETEKETGEPISFYTSMKKAKNSWNPKGYKSILEKFCRFLPVPILFEGKQDQ